MAKKFRKFWAGLLTAAMAASLMPSAAVTALADDGASADTETAAFTVYVQTGYKSKETVKEYTQAELEALAAESSAAGQYNYLYSKSDAWHVVSTDNYVTIDALLDDAGIDWSDYSENAYAQCAADDGFTTDIARDVLNASTAENYKFYPNLTNTDISNVDDAVTTPAVLALSYYLTDVAEGQTTGEAAAAAKDGELTTSFRNLSGTLEADLAEGATIRGNRLGKSIVSLTIIDPDTTVFTVYEQSADGTKETVKEYTQAELEALVEENAQQYNYLFYKSDAWNVLSTDNYVTVDALLDDAGIDLSAYSDDAYIQCAAGDGFTTDVARDVLNASTAENYKFYPNLTNTDSSNVNDAIATPLILALSYYQITAAEGQTTGEAAAAAKESGELKTGIRNMSGTLEADLKESGSTTQGKRLGSGLVSLTVVETQTNSNPSNENPSTPSDENPSAPSDENPSTPTDSTKKQAQTIKLGTTSKTLKLNMKNGKTTAKKTFNVKVTGAKTALNVTASNSKIKAIATSKSKISVTVKKGTKKGTYKVKVRAKGSSEYKQSAVKTLKVKVKAK